MLTTRAHVSARWEGKREVPVRRSPTGPRAALTSGPKCSPRGPSLFFLFSSLFFFCFLISFVTFANMLEINSNHFHKFCKIHSKVSNQHQTCFQNQSKDF
jgi:hypothetical protein